MNPASSIARFLRSTHFVSLFAALLLIMIALNPPNGVLNENEQHYFEVAHALVAPENTAALDSLVGGMPHTFVFGVLTGNLIESLGHDGAQIAGRILIALLYAWALATFFRKLSLSVTDASTAIIVFYLAGQQIMGGEWIFGGLEPKTLAYPFAIMGLGSYLARERIAPWLWLAVATSIHFHLGGLWFGLMVLCELLQRRPLRQLATGAALYALAISPIALVVAVNHVDIVATAEYATEPDVGWIFTYYRAPHHATPFASRAAFIADWLPGIALLAPLTLLSALLMSARDGSAAAPARLAFVAFCLLWFALAASAIDTQGRLGPYMLFRPSSLALLLFILAALIYIRDHAGAASWPLRLSALLLVAAVAAPALARDAVGPLHDEQRRLAQQAGLLGFLRGTPQDSVYVIQPDMERRFLGIQRETGRRVAVLFKFTPSRAEGMREWFRRREMQRELLDGNCSVAEPYRVTHVIVEPNSVNEGFVPCGPLVYQDKSFAVFAVTAQP